MSFITAQTGNIISQIGTATQGIGQIAKGFDQLKTGDFNADVLNQRAQAERQSQVLLENQKRKILRDQIGTQVATVGKSGVRLTGSPLDVIEDSIANAEMDIAIDKYNSEVSARGFETDARLEKVRAKQSATQSFLKAGGTFLSLAAEKIGSKGQQLGAGTTTHGIKVPSRFVPGR